MKLDMNGSIAFQGGKKIMEFLEKLGIALHLDKWLWNEILIYKFLIDSIAIE